MLNRTQEKRAGFTLIEVLVVVAIIALLVAILLPSLARARANARNSVDKSNLHQFGLCMQQYAIVSHGYLPRGGDPDKANHWTMLVAQQMGLFKKIKAPVGGTPGTSVNQLRVDQMEIFWDPERTAQGSEPWVGYVVNAMDPYLGGPPWEQAETKTTIDSYKRPSDVIYLACAETESKLGTPVSYSNPRKSREAWQYCRDKGWLRDETTISSAISYLTTAGNGGGIDTMDAWMGAHMPQSRSIDLPDADARYRRVARKLHLNRFTNAVMYDGSAGGFSCGESTAPLDNYLLWLKRFGLTANALTTARTAGETP